MYLYSYAVLFFTPQLGLPIKVSHTHFLFPDFVLQTISKGFIIKTLPISFLCRFHCLSWPIYLPLIFTKSSQVGHDQILL